MTFSLSAYCPTSGQFGIAVTSSSIAVAARCAFARAGVGAVATQNITDPRLGPLGLGMMEAGAPAEVALERLLADNPTAAYRQVALDMLEHVRRVTPLFAQFIRAKEGQAFLGRLDSEMSADEPRR